MGGKGLPLSRVVLLLVLVLAVAKFAGAETMTPVQEQDYSDAKSAVDDARKARADKYAPEPLRQAEDYLKTAANARESKDTALMFGRASRLARTYAELAKALAELNADTEKLAITTEKLSKTKLEIEGLK